MILLVLRMKEMRVIRRLIKVSNQWIRPNLNLSSKSTQSSIRKNRKRGLKEKTMKKQRQPREA